MNIMCLKEVSEEDQVVTLFGSLPTSFAAVVTALEAKGDDGVRSRITDSS